MSAPSIPNLLSSRGGGGRGRGRGRTRGRGAHSGTSSQENDALVQGTDTDASVSRLSAVELGYLDDPFARAFVNPGPGAPNRRLPIINRGTYARTTALDTLVDLFLVGREDADDEPSRTEKQIVSLGAGTDTRCLRLFSQPPDRRRRGARVVYHEIDFPTICARKLRVVQGTPALRQVFSAPPVAADDGSWSASAASGDGDELWCHGVDLRQLAREERQRGRGQDGQGQGQVGASMPADDFQPPSSASTVLRGLRRDIPTLLISECCLCYLSPEDASGVIAWFHRQLEAPAPSTPESTNAGFGLVLYEATRPDDAFGRVMVSNLAARGLRMPTLEAYPSPLDQETRLIKAGFGEARHATVDRIWDKWVSATEKERLDTLEGLDEVEEWLLLAAHYIVAWAWQGAGFEAWESIGV